ncbi:MAG: hypothetical protein SOZ62_02305 [Eubacteriales bacterium]|nr:hypothetical protein [Eubacteriales bacterium]
MSRKTKNSYAAVFASTVFIVFFLSVFRSWLLFNRYQPTNGSFSSDSYAIVMFTIFLSAFLIGVYSICLYKKVNLGECSVTIPTMFSSIFVSVVLLAYFLMSLIPFADVVSYRFIRLIAIIFSLFSIPYFLYGFLIHGKKNGERRVLFCMAVTVFSVLNVIIRYLSYDYPSNSPMKIHETLSLILITFFMLQECRASLGRTHWSVRIFIGLTAMVVLIPYCIPNLIYAAVKENVFAFENLITCFVIFAFAVYITVDMALLPLRKNLRGEEEKPTPDYSDMIYASKVEADRFKISDENVYEQKAKSTQLYTVNETVAEKINDGTLDTVGGFTYDSPDATEEELLSWGNSNASDNAEDKEKKN